jgi:glucose/arabinose dehydrogenase/mono/diheme cytochrome c family protein
VKTSTNVFVDLVVTFVIMGISVVPSAHAQNSTFHNAPPSAKELKNPYEGQPPAAAKRLFHLKCARCHGENGEGSGNIPSLTSEQIKSATPGELFWYITKGDINNGMPSWATLPKRQRWQIVDYVKALATSPGEGEKSKVEAPQVATKLNAPPPPPPFSDFRYEKPGKTRKIAVKDIPPPFVTSSAGNGPTVVPRPANAWPQVPPGFKVELYASGLEEPRLIRRAPNGDMFLAESKSGEIKIFRGITSAGKPEQMAVFASGMKRPFGINFYPPGPDPQWVYVASMQSVVRFPYQNGDLKARDGAQHITDLPGGEYHWTRDIQFSLDGKKMFVSIGSNSNVDDPDTSPGEKNTADILQFNPDGSGMRVYASGIRNAVGLAIQPKTGDLWCSTNERDGLGDNVVPDYITHVQDGGFYGWPWWYMGGHQDPRHKGKHPELKDKIITPDVLLQPHNASLELTFYDGKQFPAEYQGDIFAAEHGSWNRSVRTGYELIRVPLHQTGHASGEYEDFMTGFVIDNKNVWGRPVGVAVAANGSLLVSDDGSNSIWRVSYTGK